jgi:DNA-binding response OmpR family regulator
MAEKILIADDHEHYRRLMSAVLCARGYQVTTVCDGQEALDELEHSQPDLVLLDIQMPRLEGDQVCRYLKEHSDIPVMLISGLGDTSTRARVAGADAFLNKPFSLEELYKSVSALLSARPVCAHSTAAMAGVAA